jgi:hypothetical protein
MKLHAALILTLAALPVLTARPVAADLAVVEAVKAAKDGGGWRFDVTISHPDTGWEHYADGWRVLDIEGKELGMRVLVHPHETEQPFTRSLSGVALPDGTRQVRIQARCLVDGWSDDLFTVTLP